MLCSKGSVGSKTTVLLVQCVRNLACNLINTRVEITEKVYSVSFAKYGVIVFVLAKHFMTNILLFALVAMKLEQDL